MMFVVNRVEDDYAICETIEEEIIEVSISDLPKDTKRGDAIVYENGNYRIIERYAAKRKEIFEKLLKEALI